MGINPSIDVWKAKTIRYGIGKETSKDTARIDFPLQNLCMLFHIHIVFADIPMILGLDDIDCLGLHFRNVANKLIHGESGCYVTTIRYRGHAYVTRDPHIQTHFTTAELHRLH